MTMLCCLYSLYVIQCTLHRVWEELGETNRFTYFNTFSPKNRCVWKSNSRCTRLLQFDSHRDHPHSPPPPHPHHKSNHFGWSFKGDLTVIFSKALVNAFEFSLNFCFLLSSLMKSSMATLKERYPTCFLMHTSPARLRVCHASKWLTIHPVKIACMCTPIYFGCNKEFCFSKHSCLGLSVEWERTFHREIWSFCKKQSNAIDIGEFLPESINKVWHLKPSWKSFVVVCLLKSKCVSLASLLVIVLFQAIID